jgi:DNA-directed RNA polymerase subunit M/transcription elongation factor TFIIS
VINQKLERRRQLLCKKIVKKAGEMRAKYENISTKSALTPLIIFFVCFDCKVIYKKLNK